MGAHLKGIGLENFRVFKDKTWFDFAPITILTGTNNSGKSSLVRGIQLLSNFFEKREAKVGNKNEELDLMDIEELLDTLGDFSKILNNTTDNETISFFIPIKLHGILPDLKLRIDFELQKGSLKQGKLKGLTILISENNDEIYYRKELEENKYSVRINYYFFLQEYKRESEFMSEFEKLKEKAWRIEFELKDKPDLLKEEADKLNNQNPYKGTNHHKFFFNSNYGNKTEIEKDFFDYKSEVRYSENENLFLYDSLINPNKRFLPGAEYFDLNKNEYEQIENEFLLNFKYIVTDNYLVSLISRPLMPISYITDPTSLFSANHDWGNGYKSSYDLDVSMESNELAKRVKKEQTSICSMMSLPTNAKDDEDESSLNFEEKDSEKEDDKKELTMSEFFFEYFVSSNITYSLFEVFNLYFKDSNFISTFRNPIQRIYTLKDNPIFTQVLSQMIKTQEKNEDSIHLAFMNKYISEFKLGTSVVLERNSEGLGTHIYIMDKEKKTLLADMGYGISQVLPLIFQIVLAGIKNEEKRTKLFIEEPEANLHPALQSKLADMFVEAMQKFNIQFVIETHSEYLIRRLQVLTANTYTETNKNENWVELKTFHTQLYYFYQADAVPEGEEQVYKINIEEDGALTKNFGKGFFDESSNLNIALYNFTTANKN